MVGLVDGKAESRLVKTMTDGNEQSKLTFKSSPSLDDDMIDSSVNLVSIIAAGGKD